MNNNETKTYRMYIKNENKVNRKREKRKVINKRKVVSTRETRLREQRELINVLQRKFLNRDKSEVKVRERMAPRRKEAASN